MLLSLYVPLRMASSISCIFFKLSSPSACKYRNTTKQKKWESILCDAAYQLH